VKILGRFSGKTGGDKHDQVDIVA